MTKELKEYPTRELAGAEKIFDFFTKTVNIQGFYQKKDGRGKYPFIIVYENKAVEPHTFEVHRANNPCNFENVYNLELPTCIKMELEPFKYG